MFEQAAHPVLRPLTLTACTPRSENEPWIIIFRRRAHQSGVAVSKAMIHRNDLLTMAWQANLLNVNRSSIYYLPKPISDADQQLMLRIDKLHLEPPFAGARMLSGLLR